MRNGRVLFGPRPGALDRPATPSQTPRPGSAPLLTPSRTVSAQQRRCPVHLRRHRRGRAEGRADCARTNDRSLENKPPSSSAPVVGRQGAGRADQAQPSESRGESACSTERSRLVRWGTLHGLPGLGKSVNVSHGAGAVRGATGGTGREGLRYDQLAAEYIRKHGGGGPVIGPAALISAFLSAASGPRVEWPWPRLCVMSAKRGAAPAPTLRRGAQPHGPRQAGEK
jgi:hypothetical protein